MDIFEITAALVCIPLYLWNVIVGDVLFYIPSWWCLPFSFWTSFLLFDFIIMGSLIAYDFTASPNRFLGKTYYYWY